MISKYRLRCRQQQDQASGLRNIILQDAAAESPTGTSVPPTGAMEIFKDLPQELLMAVFEQVGYILGSSPSSPKFPVPKFEANAERTAAQRSRAKIPAPHLPAVPRYGNAAPLPEALLQLHPPQ